MKHICTILLLCAFANNYPFPQNGSLVGEDINPNYINHYRIPFVSDKILYVNGGVTINYPITFDSEPVVNVTIELVSTFSPTTTYAAFILTNTSTSTTIIVNKITYDVDTEITTITAAADQEVALHIWAVDV